MKQLLAFIKKEFLHVLRDGRTLLVLFGVPIMQILIFGFALSNEVKNSHIVVIDHAHDVLSRRLIQKFDESHYFHIDKYLHNNAEIEDAFQKGKIKMALIIPAEFGRDLMRKKQAKVQIIADASNPNTATTLESYARSILGDFQRNIAGRPQKKAGISTSIKMLYNPMLESGPNFVPGVISLILMLICVMMTAVSIVKEKELGTMEVLLVSPFKPIYVILAKAVPYIVLSLLDLVIILLLSTFVLGVHIEGSILFLFAESTLFIITCLALGILISTIVESQRVALMASLLGMLLPTILFSGFMFPIENMPAILQWISNIVPSKWFYTIVKSIMIKGLGIQFLWKETLLLLMFGTVFFVISLKTFKTRLE